MITSEGWAAPVDDLKEMYSEALLSREELAKRMGAKPRTLQSWANRADSRTISFADWFLLRAIIKERANEVAAKHDGD